MLQQEQSAAYERAVAADLARVSPVPMSLILFGFGWSTACSQAPACTPSVYLLLILMCYAIS